MSRQVRTGIVLIGGVVVFLLLLFTIADRSFLFGDTVPIHARYSSVAGLTAGAQVQYQGVTVGRVQGVHLPEEPGEKITVSMAIRNSAIHLVTEGTQAQIKTDGLVGNQIVVLVNPPFARTMTPIAEDGVITGIDPFDLFEITDKMLSTVAQFDSAAATFQQIMIDVQGGEGSLGKLVYDDALYEEFVSTTNSTRRTMNNLADNAESLVELAHDATEGVNVILEQINAGEGTFAKMIHDPSFYTSLLTVADTLQGILTDMRTITHNAENVTNWGAIGAFRFAELMEAAKHNWLFRRYFEERGYMEQAPFEQREAAIAQSFADLERQRRELLDWEQRLAEREEALSDSLGSGSEGVLPDSVATSP